MLRSQSQKWFYIVYICNNRYFHCTFSGIFSPFSTQAWQADRFLILQHYLQWQFMHSLPGNRSVTLDKSLEKLSLIYRLLNFMISMGCCNTKIIRPFQVFNYIHKRNETFCIDFIKISLIGAINIKHSYQSIILYYRNNYF